MGDDVVQLEEQRGYRLLRLNRPAVHNAIDDAVMERLEAVLDDLDRREDLEPLVVTGTGDRTFCAGGDLRYFATLRTAAAGRAMSRRMQRILSRLADGRRPVIAAVNGDALGGGCELLTACHLRLASDAARFCFKQAGLGLVTGWGGGVRLFELVGRGAALGLLLTSETVDAETARRLGLVDRVLPAGGVLAAAGRLAESIARHPPAAVASFLEIARLAGGDRAAAVRRETELFSELWGGDDFQGRLARWRGGDPPDG